MFSLDRTTHCRLIEPLSDSHHLKTSLMSRYVKFSNSLRTCNKFSVRYLARIESENMNSKMGKTLNYIAEGINIDRREIFYMSSRDIKRNLSYSRVEEENEWEMSICRELLQSRGNAHQTMEIPGFSHDEIQNMLINICTT